MGAHVRTVWPQTRLCRHFCCLCLLPSWLRLIKEHRIHSHLPTSERDFRSCSPGQFRVRSFSMLSSFCPSTDERHNFSAVIADVWDARSRGKATALYALSPFAGPALAPVCSGYMTVAGVSWRWGFWLLAMFAGVCLVLVVFTIPETHVCVHTTYSDRSRTDASWSC